MPVHGLHNPRDKMTAGTESVALTCGLALGLAIWTVKLRNMLPHPKPPSSPPPPLPRSLPGTNNAGTDALLNSSGGSDAWAEKTASGGPPRFTASHEKHRCQWGRQFGSFLHSLQTKLTFCETGGKKTQWLMVRLNVNTPEGSLAAPWSLWSELCSLIFTPQSSPSWRHLWLSPLMEPRHLWTSVTI